MFDFLNNKKTYLVAIALGVLETVRVLGIVDDGTASTIRNLLLTGGLFTLRAAIMKAQLR
jgi:hypothetical protein